MTTYEANIKDCICDPGMDRTGRFAGFYTVGCPYHIALAIQEGPRVSRKGIEAHTVTYFHAEVKVSVPVLRDGDVWSQEHFVTCDHNHETIEAAEACAERLARKAPSMVVAE